MRRGLFALLAAVAVLVLSPVRTSAATSVQAGWWTTVPAATAPDAPADGLVLEGGPDLAHPVAFAAVNFSIATGTTPSRLKLDVAPNTATTPNASITVCPLTKPFKPAQGGSMSDAPTYDCSTKATAAASSNGSSYTVDVGNLIRNGALSIALLPSSVTDRVVLSKPSAGSLQAAGGAGFATPSAAGKSAPASPSASGSAPNASASHVSVRPTPSAGATSPAAGAAAPASAPAAAAAPRNASAQTVAAKSDGRSRLPALAFVGLAALAAALWLSAGARSDGPAAVAAAGGPSSTEGEPR